MAKQLVLFASPFIVATKNILRDNTSELKDLQHNIL